MNINSVTDKLTDDTVSNLQVCAAAVGLMGDLCRALGVKVMPYCDETMVMLLENLGVCMHIGLLCHIAAGANYKELCMVCFFVEAVCIKSIY